MTVPALLCRAITAGTVVCMVIPAHLARTDAGCRTVGAPPSPQQEFARLRSVTQRVAAWGLVGAGRPPTPEGERDQGRRGDDPAGEDPQVPGVQSVIPAQHGDDAALVEVPPGEEQEGVPGEHDL